MFNVFVSLGNLRDNIKNVTLLHLPSDYVERALCVTTRTYREAQKSLLTRRNMFILTADTVLKFPDCSKFLKVSSTLAYCRNVSRTPAQDHDDEVV